MTFCTLFDCNVRVCSFYYIEWRHLVNLLPLNNAILKLKHNGLLTLMLICLLSNVDESGEFLQGVSIACYASPVLATIGMSVCVSVCPSATRWHWVKTTQARITKSSPTDSPRTLVFRIKCSSRNSNRFTPSEGDKWEYGRKNSQFSANKSPYLRNGSKVIT